MKFQACAVCGAPGAVPIKGETFRLSHKCVSAEVKNLSGWRCAACCEVGTLRDPQDPNGRWTQRVLSL